VINLQNKYTKTHKTLPILKIYAKSFSTFLISRCSKEQRCYLKSEKFLIQILALRGASIAENFPSEFLISSIKKNPKLLHNIMLR
jgi:hypothetical protein